MKQENQTILKSDTVSEILSKIDARLRTQHCIVSFTFVGSSYRHRRPSRYTDLDLVIILESMTQRNKDIIEGIFRGIADEYRSATLDVIFENKVGPIKHQTTKNKLIILHLLLFDIALYKEYCMLNRLTPSSWQGCNPLFGKALFEICKIERITKEDVLHSRSGIYHFIDLVEGGRIDALVLERKDSLYRYVPKRMKVKKEGFVELMLHCILKSAGNVLRLFTDIDVNDEVEVATKFKDLFSNFAFCNVPAVALSEKWKIRNMDIQVGEEFVRKMREETLSFLSELAKLLEGSVDQEWLYVTKNRS